MAHANEMAKLVGCRKRQAQLTIGDALPRDATTASGNVADARTPFLEPWGEAIMFDPPRSMLGGAAAVASGTVVGPHLCARAVAGSGNVTSPWSSEWSNAVNVFLGLGLPWMLSSIYWTARGERSCDLDGGKCPDLIGDTKGFYLPAGDLSFSVIVFVILAVTSLIILLLRNSFCDGALGGKPAFKKPTACLFVCFWLIYIILASLKTEKYFEDY